MAFYSDKLYDFIQWINEYNFVYEVNDVDFKNIYNRLCIKVGNRYRINIQTDTFLIKIGSMCEIVLENNERYSYNSQLDLDEIYYKVVPFYDFNFASGYILELIDKLNKQ